MICKAWKFAYQVSSRDTRVARISNSVNCWNIIILEACDGIQESSNPVVCHSDVSLRAPARVLHSYQSSCPVSPMLNYSCNYCSLSPIYLPRFFSVIHMKNIKKIRGKYVDVRGENNSWKFTGSCYILL